MQSRVPFSRASLARVCTLAVAFATATLFAPVALAGAPAKAAAKQTPQLHGITVVDGRVQSLDTPVAAAASGRTASDGHTPTWWFSSAQVSPALETAQLQQGDASAKDKKASPTPTVQTSERTPPGYVPVQVPFNAIQLKLASQGSGTVVWYRRALVFPAARLGRLSLRLGEISDIDRVYLNGVQIGGLGDWNSHAFQAYDRIRIYDIPTDLVRPGQVNLVHVQVRGSFPDFLGIFRDRTEIGPSVEIWRTFYYENVIPLLALAFYLAAGSYFLFLFIRRRHEYENLFFGLFVIALVLYQFLRTQLKYDLGLEFLTLKKAEYIVLQAIVPLFYLFIRAYYPAEDERSRKVWLRFGLIMHAVILGVVVAVLFFESPVVWWTLNKFVTQSMWLVYFSAAIWILGSAAKKRHTDARIMIATFAVLIFCTVVDLLTSRGYWNLPQLVPWGFVAFVLGFAVILANRFVRLNDETDRLNVVLEGQARSFHRFVPTQFLEILGKTDLQQVNLGDSAQLRMTILFSDLRSFTSLSESMSPKDNFNFLNSYLKRMEPAIKEHGGFVDKFIGDAIMALFPDSAPGAFGNSNGNGARAAALSAPALTASDSAVRAVAAAIEMRRGLKEYNRHRRDMSYQPIDVGIGLNTGELMLGTVGSSSRLDTTVIGDSVNMASRVEALTPIYHVGILISDATQAALPSDRFLLREVDTIVVKGKSDPVLVYEVFDADDPQTQEQKLAAGGKLQGAIGLYKAREFQAALAMFEALSNAHPEDGLYAMYVRRCRKLIATPPGAGWRGAVRLRHK